MRLRRAESTAGVTLAQQGQFGEPTPAQAWAADRETLIAVARAAGFDRYGKPIAHRLVLHFGNGAIGSWRSTATEMALAVLRPALVPETEARIRTLEAAVQTLTARLNALEPVSDADFLAVVATSVEGRVFDVEELVAHARVAPALHRGGGAKRAGQGGTRPKVATAGPSAGYNRRTASSGYVRQQEGRGNSGSPR